MIIAHFIGKMIINERGENALNVPTLRDGQGWPTTPRLRVLSIKEGS
jgi:hypothetical protein